MADANTAPEIEITAEMIEAGEIEMARFDDAFESPDEAVVKIFKAMMRASKISDHHASAVTE